MKCNVRRKEQKKDTQSAVREGARHAWLPGTGRMEAGRRAGCRGPGAGSLLTSRSGAGRHSGEVPRAGAGRGQGAGVRGQEGSPAAPGPGSRTPCCRGRPRPWWAGRGSCPSRAGGRGSRGSCWEGRQEARLGSRHPGARAGRREGRREGSPGQHLGRQTD